MEAVNIYTYSRIQEDMATEFENILSQRSKKLEELFSIYQDITVENKNSKNMVPSNYFFSPFYNRCVCAGIKFLKRCWKKEFFPLNKAVVDSYCNTLLPLLSEISMRAIIQEMHILKEKTFM